MENNKSRIHMVAIGPRAPEDRLAWGWLTALGIALGVGSTVAVVHHFDANQPHGAVPPAQSITQAIQAAGPRIRR